MQGGGGHQQWIYIIMPILIALDKALLEIGHMSREDQRAYLAALDPPLTLTAILDQLMTLYLQLRDRNEWYPAQHIRHNRRHQANNAVPALPPSTATAVPDPQANQLVPSPSSNSNNNSGRMLCYGCGQPDHMIRDCPHANRGSNNNNRNSSSNSNNNRSNGNRNSARNPFAAPNAGGHTDRPTGQFNSYPVYERMIQGTRYRWCGRCNNNQGRWTQNHSTGGHTEPGSRSSTSGRNNPRNNGGRNQGRGRGRGRGNGGRGS